MPLPLPNLDSRRWADLVEEGRALVPRYAGEWTDHNVHDPGITLIELFAYLIEGLLYRANRIPERHRRKFMALAGFVPRPPRPARAMIQARLLTGAARLDLPAGTILTADTDQGPVGFSLARDATFLEVQLRAVQVYDGTSFTDRTRPALGRVAFPAFGPNPVLSGPTDPERAPALYLGFDRPLLPGAEASLSFQLQDQREGEEDAIRAEARAQEDCRSPGPDYPCQACPPVGWCAELNGSIAHPAAAASNPAIPSHHSVRLAWEYRALDTWRPLVAANGNVEDPTRGLTLDGVVRVRVPGPMAALPAGAVLEPLYYLRCRFVAGEYDEAPVVVGPLENAAPVLQRVPRWQTLPIVPGTTVTAPTVGQRQPLDLGFDADGRVTVLGPGPADGRPEPLVLDFTAPTVAAEGAVTLSLERVLTGSGLPDQVARLEPPQVADGAVELVTIESPGWRRWDPRLDLDASDSHDLHFTLDSSEALLRFGDGVRGRVPPDGWPVLASYSVTRASLGNVREGVSWSIDDNPWNRTLLSGAGHTVATANARLRSALNPFAATGGAEQETVDSLERRAAESLWAHERLIQLAPTVEPVTLDQTEPAEVRRRAAPGRATNVLDFERLALEVPGTRVRRARAWANLDPNFPCLDAAGTVTVVIVPALPRGRPRPGPGLLRAVRRFLERRRLVGTRLVVVGPEYLTVDVRAKVGAYRNADAGNVRERVLGALRDFLDPLHGGPAGLGWPFGRDVYRGEIMAVIDGVAGVDHVIDCSLAGDGAVAACDNLCVSPTWLVASGDHAIEVQRA